MDLGKYESTCKKEGIDLIEFEIIEMNVPEKEKIQPFKDMVIAKAILYLKDSKNILIHCRGGIGRASTVAACILGHIFKGAKFEDVIKLLRRRRDKKAVESYKQEQFIKKYFTEIH